MLYNYSMQKDNKKIIKWVFFSLFCFQIIYLLSVSGIFGHFWMDAQGKREVNELITYSPFYFKNGYYYLYFTTISNLLLALSGALFVLKPTCVHRKRFFFISIIYMTITFLFYWGLISWNKSTLHTWKNPLKTINSILVHLVFYIQAIVVLFIYKENIIMSFKEILFGTIGLWIYLAFALILFYSTSPHVIIYDFINFNKPLFINTDSPILRGVIITIIVLLMPIISSVIGLIFKLLLIIRFTKKRVI